MNQKFRTILTILLFIGSIAIIAVTLVLVVKEKKRARVIQDEIHALEQEKRSLEHENATLQDRIAYLRSEHSYEKEAKKLNYKNPGENVVIIRRAQKAQEDDGVVEKEKINETQKKAHHRVWFECFF